MGNTIPHEISERAVAFLVLKAHGEGRRLDEAIAEGFSSHQLSTPGRSLVTELVNGVVRQKARLDHHLLFFYPGAWRGSRLM